MSSAQRYCSSVALTVECATQVNLCTLAIREEQLPDLFSLPGSSRVHISVRKGVTAEANVRLPTGTPCQGLLRSPHLHPLHMS